MSTYRDRADAVMEQAAELAAAGPFDECSCDEDSGECDPGAKVISEQVSVETEGSAFVVVRRTKEVLSRHTDLAEAWESRSKHVLASRSSQKGGVSDTPLSTERIN